ncbi:hypothetical protein [Pedobacter sp. Hv1]|uniref:hypothetical protein n=1 Tax=Pedobacter sp. Hv1 TaxID=1740090 RepID=UPI0006D8AB5D|nr:hypothetical protein [Pedobacter sp. Hv1]KQC02363.1 hypothetical protein AQF98_01940 [Pedobacter sp. Hv1]
MNFKRGEILRASKRGRKQGFHYIIYYSGFDNNNFIGAMLTSMVSDKNVLLSPEHFEQYNPQGDRYQVQFDDSYVVIAKLIKLESWGPFIPKGQLSQIGCEFITDLIDNLQEETWEDYLKRTK